jgi:SAM-dependent methyltransferase
MSSAIRFYDAFASFYDAAYGDIDADETVRQWSDLLKATGCFRVGARLLDVGCGPGHYLEPWSREGYAVEGLDGSPAMLGLAAARYSGPLHCLDVRDLPSRADLSGRFDLVVAHFNFLHLFPPDELPAVFRGLSYITTSPGLFVCDFSPVATSAPATIEHHGVLSAEKTVHLDTGRAVSRWYGGRIDLPLDIFWFHDFQSVGRIASSEGLDPGGAFRWCPQETIRFKPTDALEERGVLFFHHR